MNNEKGYTLIEILIALAILAIMSTPVLNIFTDSIRINKMADNQYKSDFIAQKFIEDLRFGDLPVETNTIIEYENFNVSVVYKELINDVESQVGEIVSNFNLPEIDLEIEMYKDLDANIALKNENFNLSNLNLVANDYLLKIENTSEVIYKTILSYGDLKPIHSVEVSQNNILNDRPLVIKIFKESTLVIDDQDNITFDILNTTSKNVEIYVINDELKIFNFIISPSSNKVKIYRNISALEHISTNNFKSYDVEITVSKNGVEYTKLKTVISKD